MNLAKLMAGAAMLTIFASAALCGPDESAKDQVKGNNETATDLYAKLKDKEGNIFFSPYSISTALAMTYEGARNNTEKQMAETLHFKGGLEQTAKSFTSVQAALNAVEKKGNAKLSIANAIWAQKEYKFLDSYIGLVQKSFSSEIRNVDFKNEGAREDARQEINGWVEKKTNDKIKDLISRSTLSADTKMVLVNAIYFKGSWAVEFDKSLTNNDGKFTTADGKEVKVPMMYRKDDFRNLDDGKILALEMPYKDNELSMLAIMPKDPAGFADMEKALNADRIEKIVSDMRKDEIEVYFPKFRLEQKFELCKTLAEMGMPDAFDGKADFSGMNGKTTLAITGVIHKAFVEVDEKGTEAAAATAVVMQDLCIRETKAFKADRPFIFIIRENSTGSILFMGRVADPTQNK